MAQSEFEEVFYNIMWGDFDLESTFPYKRPFLAHYTSLDVLEKVCQSEEVWFSHPLNMNDHEELRFGLMRGLYAVHGNHAIRDACGERIDFFREAFETIYRHFEKHGAFDTYVFCLSLHDLEQDKNGKLSMWRGYGGNGTGVAIVIDTSALEDTENSPLIIAPVNYYSREERDALINQKLNQLAEAIKKHELTDACLQAAAGEFFNRLKMFALFTKHEGFKEECEWRIVYDIDRDPEKGLADSYGYHVTSQGVQPKLKLKITPREGVTGKGVSMENLIHQIILGPTHQHELNILSVERMLEQIRPGLADRVIASEIPFRP